MGSAANTLSREPWNKGKIVGRKAPFKVKDIWAFRVRLQMENRVRELALFNLGIDSKLRGGFSGFNCKPHEQPFAVPLGVGTTSPSLT